MRTGLAAAAVSTVLLVAGVALAQSDSQAQAQSPAFKGGKSAPTRVDPAKVTQIPTSGPPMVVQIVRSASVGCEPTCAEWIAAQGRIDASTPRQFRKILGKLGNRKLPVLIDSAGGTVDEALAVGRLIRAKGLDVAVSKSELVACGATDDVCRTAKVKGVAFALARSRAARCASSCAFLLAGGKRRFVGQTAFAGVHQLTTYETRVKVLRTYRIETRTEWGVPVVARKTLVSEKKIAEKTTQTATTKGMYDKVRKYFAEMGVGDPMMSLLLATPSSSIHWLSRAELQKTALATDLVDGVQLLAGEVGETMRLKPPPTAPSESPPAEAAPPPGQ